MKDYILYHAHCNDGKMAAAVAFKALHSDNLELKVIACNYSEPVPELENADDVYVVDFSFHGEDLEKLCRMAQRVTILDHHKGALEKMQATADQFNNLTLVFDKSKSGALITWEYFNEDTVPDIVADVSDRDLWKFKRPNSKVTHLGLAGMKWQDLAEQPELFTEGGYESFLKNKAQPRFDYAEQIEKTLAKNATSITLLGQPIYALDCHMMFCSNVAHLVIDADDAEHSCILVYMIRGDDVKLSFRSNDGHSARHFAQSFGGGGHDDAAGANCDLKTLMAILSSEV